MSTEGQKPETPEPEDPTQATTPAHELAIPLDPRLMLRERGLRGYWDVFRRRGEAGAAPPPPPTRGSCGASAACAATGTSSDGGCRPASSARSRSSSAS